MRRALVAIGLAATVAGCAREPELPRLRIKVRAKPSAAGLAVLDGGRPLGRLDQAGELTIAVRPGTAHRLDVRCPPGFVAPPLDVSIPPGGEGGEPRTAELVCELVHRALVVLVSTGAVGLPVLVNGVEQARTDDAGHAWVRSDRAPGEDVLVAVSTAGTQLFSETPSRTFRQPERDELVVFAMELEQRLPKRRARPVPQGPRGPYRLR